MDSNIGQPQNRRKKRKKETKKCARKLLKKFSYLPKVEVKSENEEKITKKRNWF